MNDLTPEEVEKVRGLIEEGERAAWAFKKLKVLVPIVVAVVVAVWQAGEWVVRHVRVH
jgi:hypothetical protein